MKTYIAKAVAKDNCLLPGGVKQWQSFPQATREEAKNVLAGYIDGAKDKVSFTSIREIAQKKTFRVYWSPEGKCIATVKAFDAVSARRMAPMPYRKFLGEIYAEETLS